MRHLFDQYSQPENKLTHALVSSLAQDRKLLRKFVYWSVGQCISRKEKLSITEQSYPGQEEMDERESERRGLPDAWIYTDYGWALLIESKVASGISLDQLQRHARMARRRGFSKFKLLVINIDSKEKKLPRQVFNKTWRDIYEWGIREATGSQWAKQFTSYLEIAEAKMAEQQYLKEGTLTKFSGVHFDSENPYTYFEGKRILGLLIETLKSDRPFIKRMGIDPSLPGRGAIKGVQSSFVWDFLRLKESRRAKLFTDYPHITLGIHAESVSVGLTIPNGVRREIRKRFLNGGYDSFESLIGRVSRGMKRAFQIDSSAKPFIKILQRHYPSQSSPAIDDAILKFDMRTAFRRRKSHEKYQPQWLRAAYDVMTNRRSNIQFQISFEVFCAESAVIKTPRVVAVIKEAIFAYKPVLDCVLSRTR